MHTAAYFPAPLPAPAGTDDPWLTLRDCSARARLHEATLRRDIRAGRLRAARVGGRKAVRIRRSWLDAYLERYAAPVE